MEMRPKHLRSAALALAALALAVMAAFRAEGAPIPWKLPKYTLVARDMNLRTALDTFAVAEGLSVVMSQNVAGMFSGEFRDVPAGEFLDRIATLHNLTWYYDGAALYIYGAGEIQTLLVDLQYMKAAEVRSMLGELEVEDARFPLKTTSDDEIVLVSGPPRYVAIIAELIEKADRLREKRTFNEVEMRLFPLVHTWADNVSFSVSSPESTMMIKGVAQILEEMMSNSGDGKTHEAAVTNEMSRLDETQSAAFRPVIRPDNRLNAVLVRDVAARLAAFAEGLRLEERRERGRRAERGESLPRGGPRGQGARRRALVSGEGLPGGRVALGPEGEGQGALDLAHVAPHGEQPSGADNGHAELPCARDRH